MALLLLSLAFNLAGASPAAAPAVTGSAAGVGPPAFTQSFPQVPPKSTYTLPPVQPGLYPHASSPVFASTSPTPTQAAKRANQPAQWQVWMFNSFGAPLSVSYAANAGAPTSIQGTAVPTPGLMHDGDNTLISYPTGWAGRIIVGYGGTYVDSRGSKIEGSFVGNPAQIDIDVSYVDGFSAPIQCYANGQVITGCTHSLWAEKKCPQGQQSQNSCVCLNPQQTVPCGPPTAFFAACQGHAYTYPDDDHANSDGETTNTVVCCVDQWGSTTNKCPSDPYASHLQYGSSPNPQCGGSGSKRSTISERAASEPVDPAEGHWYYNSTMFTEYQQARRDAGLEPEAIPAGIFRTSL